MILINDTMKKKENNKPNYNIRFEYKPDIQIGSDKDNAQLYYSYINNESKTTDKSTKKNNKVLTIEYNGKIYNGFLNGESICYNDKGEEIKHPLDFEKVINKHCCINYDKMAFINVIEGDLTPPNKKNKQSYTKIDIVNSKEEMIEAVIKFNNKDK